MIEYLWLFWLVAGITLLVADMVIVGSFYLMWLGLSCMLVAGILGLAPDLSILVQVILWGVFSFVLLACWVMFGKKILKRINRPEKMLGVTGVITEWHDGTGKIRFQRPYDGNDLWQAASSDRQFSIGDNAKVTKIEYETRTVTVVST